MTLAAVPNALYVGHTWLKDTKNLKDLRAYFAKHDIDIQNVVVANFYPDEFEVVVHLRDESGKLVINDRGDGAMTTVVKVPYRGKKPKVMKEGRPGEGPRAPRTKKTV